MVYEGREALDRVAQLGALRDGEIRDFRIFSVDGVSVCAELTCRPRESSSVALMTMRFEDLSEVSFYWAQRYSFYLVVNYKGLLLATGEVYVSLDPYDAVEVATIPDERDQDMFVAEKVIVTMTMK